MPYQEVRDAHSHDVTTDGSLMSCLVVPVVNLNGNDAQQMALQCIDVKRSLSEAIQRLRSLGADICHGRNYQTLPLNERSDAMEQAIIALSERVLLLTMMELELERLAVLINNQSKDRN